MKLLSKMLTFVARVRCVFIWLDYRTIDELVELIDEPLRSVCVKDLRENRALFERIPGSTHNHQTWSGGYIDHVTDGMNYARHLYAFDRAFGRPIPFTLSDVLFLFYWHDREKPARIVVDGAGNASNRLGFDTKEAFKRYREAKLAECGVVPSAYQLNGLTYVEGEGKDYRSTERVMNELAAFCHKVDNWSARGWYQYPKPSGEDEWYGAGRFRT